MNAKIYRADGEIVEITPANGTYFQLEEMQKIVGGLVQFLDCDDENLTMVIDEEGKCKNKPFNSEATEMVSTTIPTWDVVVGDVIVCDSNLIQ